MRKLHYGLLLGASALALAPAAHAAEGLSMGVGGELSQYFGYVSNDEDGLSGFDLKAYGEVTFGGELELDNGLAVGVEVVMVGTQGEDDAIDGSHMTIGGGHGLFEIGQLDNVAATMQVSAPDVGLGVNESDIGDWVFSPSDADDDSAFAATYLYLGEGGANKINYYTPRMNGLQFGLTYIPAFEREGQGMPERDAAARDAFALGANYEAEFGAAAVAVSAGYLTAAAPEGGGADAVGYSVGVNVAVGNVTVGASWASTEGHPEGGTDTEVSFDGTGFDIGVAYAFEDAEVSLSYYSGEVEDNVETPGDSTYEALMASAATEIGEGVSVVGSVFHVTYASDGGEDNEGVGAVAGFVVEF